MLTLVSWRLAASVGIILLTSITAIETTCVDSSTKPMFSVSCDPQVIHISSVTTGSGTCTSDKRTLCTDTAGTLNHFRTGCQNRQRCIIMVNNDRRPQCTVGSDPFNVFVTYSCVGSAVTTTTTSSSSTTRTTTTTATKTTATIHISSTPATIIPEASSSAASDVTDVNVEPEESSTTHGGASTEHNQKNSKPTKPKVLVIALSVLVVVIVVVIVITVIICMLRKRKTKHEKEAHNTPAGPKNSFDTNASPHKKAAPDEVTVVPEIITVGEDGRDCPHNVIDSGSDEGNMLYTYDQNDAPRGTRVEQSLDMYSEVQHEKQIDAVPEEKKGSNGSNVYSVAQKSSLLDIYSEVHKDKHVPDVYSLVNKVQGDPDEIELHDNPMYDSHAYCE